MTRPAQLKLKAWAEDGSGLVAVFQDGSAADSDATTGRKYDNSFTTGALPSGKTLQVEREWIDVKSLTHNVESGKTLTLGVNGLTAWKNDQANAYPWTPNDTVELYAQVPTPDSTVATASWHLNGVTPGTQVRMFYGHVADVSVDADDGLQITCRDTQWTANLIKLERSAPDSITIPKIAFNLPREHPDFIYSIKLVSSASATPLGMGESAEADTRATLGQILDYLQTHYRTRLVDEGVLDTSLASSLFATADIGPLTVKPTQIILQDCGFADGVKQIIRTWAPHLRLVVDHRTTQWRFIQHGPKLTETYANGTSGYGNFAGVGYASVGSVDTPGAFSVGMRVRMYGGGTTTHPQYCLTQEKTLAAIVGNELRFVEQGTYFFNSGSWKAYPVATDALAVLNLSVDDVPSGGVSLSQDADGVYSAVNLYSVNQVTESRNEAWNRQSYTGSILQHGWDTSFEAAWTDKEGDREEDVGADGEGLKPYTIGNDGTHDYITVSYAQSQYNTRHTSNEWQDCSIWIWTMATADIRNLNRTYKILTSQHMADCGDGTAGLKITVDTGVGKLLIDSPTFITVAGGGPGADRVILTQDKKFKTTGGNNKMWEVGRKFYFNSQTVTLDASSSPHSEICTDLKITSDNGTESARRVSAMHPGLGYPAVNVTPAGAFEQLAGGGLGATFVWRRATYTRTPTGSPCTSGTGWTPPRLVQVDYETTTTTLRNARYPATSYAGPAFARYGIASEYTALVQDWTDDSQTADYTDLAFRLWQVKSHAHHQGTVRKPGIKENGVWLDLAIDVNLNSSLAGTLKDNGSGYGGFSGTLTECTWDFENDEVIFGFDNGGEDLQIDIYEELMTKQVSTIADLSAYAKALKQLNDCARGSQAGEQPSSVCSSRVYYKDGNTVEQKITTVIGKPQQESGASATGVSDSS